MWRCLNCETMNEGKFCINCGASKPSDEQPEALKREEEAKKAAELENAQSLDEAPRLSATEYSPAPAGAPPYAPPVRKKKTGLIVCIIILVVLLIGGTGVGIYYLLNNDGNGINAGVDAEQLQYEEAMELLNSGKYEDAKAKFKGLKSYSDSATMVKECDYRFAESEADNENYIEAYELYDDLGEYKESKKRKNNLKSDIYETGIEYYKDGSYDDAEEYFEYISGYKRTDDYLLLIDAHNEDIYDVSPVFDILDFEDAKEIIMSNEDYAFEFLKGYWSSSNGTLSFYKQGSSMHCEYGIPAPDGSSWEIRNGIHYFGSPSAGWQKAWEYTIVSRDSIRVYCYSDGITYTMKRD